MQNRNASTGESVEGCVGLSPQKAKSHFTIDHHSYKVCCDCGATLIIRWTGCRFTAAGDTVGAQEVVVAAAENVAAGYCPQFLDPDPEAAIRARITPARHANLLPLGERFPPKSASLRMAERHYRPRQAFGLLRQRAIPPAIPGRPDVPDE